MTTRTETVIPVVEETLEVGRRRVTSERVRILRDVEVETREVAIPLRREELEIERVPVDLVCDEPPKARCAGGVVVIPIVEEEVIVQRRYRVREELHVRTVATTVQHTQRVELRHHRVSIERTPHPEERRMTRTVVAGFGNSNIADDTVRDLLQHGLRNEAIEVADSERIGASKLIGDLDAREVPHERSEVYAEAVRRGSAVVVVDTSDEQVSEVVQVMEQHHPIDLGRSAERWRKEGWSGFRSDAQGYSPEQRAAEQKELEHETFDVIEEEIRVGKRERQEGVRIHSFVTERPVTKNIELREEKIDVNREPASEVLSPEQADAAFKEGETVVTATSEEPVVEKRARVVERVQIAKEAETRGKEITGTERRRDVEVEPTEETERKR